MTPKEKADELIKKFKRYDIDKDDVFFDMDDAHEDSISAIYNSITCVDEILNITPMYVGNLNPNWKYFSEVKTILENKLK